MALELLFSMTNKVAYNSEAYDTDVNRNMKTIFFNILKSTESDQNMSIWKIN